MHDGLQEGFSFCVTLFLSKFDIKLLTHADSFCLLEIHNSLKDFVNGIKNKHVEGTLKRFFIGISRFG